MTKISSSFQKWTKDVDRHFSKECVQMTNKSKKVYPISLIIRKMKRRTTLRYHIITRRKTLNRIKTETENKKY
jgi:hypothetical protein